MRKARYISYLLVYEAKDKADDTSDCQWEDTIAQDANTLKKRDGAP